MERVEIAEYRRRLAEAEELAARQQPIEGWRSYVSKPTEPCDSCSAVTYEVHVGDPRVPEDERYVGNGLSVHSAHDENVLALDAVKSLPRSTAAMILPVEHSFRWQWTRGKRGHSWRLVVE